MEKVLSGLDRRALRMLGESGIQLDGSIKWLSFADLQIALSESGPVAPRQVFWLYRSPALATIERPQESEHTDPGDPYRRWMDANRFALDLRSRLGERLKFINVDQVAAEWLEHELGVPVSHEVARGPSDGKAVANKDAGVLAIAEHLLSWAAPQLWEIYEALELIACGSTAESIARIRMAPAEEDVLDVISLLVAGQYQLQGRSVVSREIARSVANELASVSEDARIAKNEVPRHDSFLMKHLRSLQEELERYYGRSRALADSEGRLRQDCKALQDERDALRNQLEHLQDEMIALATRVPTPPQQMTRSLGRRVVGYVPNRIRARRERARQVEERNSHLALIRDSGLFDREWYLDAYSDVGRAGVDPVEHYFEFGWREGRNPGPSFNTRFYLTMYPDVLASGMNPLLHYVMHGRSEGRSTSKDA